VERLISRAAAPIELEAWFIILTIVGTAWWFGWGQGSEPVDRLYAIGLT
jgi:hypothetical protein